MAFVSDETGDYQVYVPACRTGTDGCRVQERRLSPIWSADGRELFFRPGGKVSASAMSSAAPLGFSAPPTVDS